MFANRYKDISPEKLSFNLVNEPNNVSEEVYVSIMKKVIDAIHEVTPNRVIFVDGLGYGRGLLLSLKNEPNIAQAIHSYDPFSLTHYKASWVEGSMDWPVPTWPMLSISNYLYLVIIDKSIQNNLNNFGEMCGGFMEKLEAPTLAYRTISPAMIRAAERDCNVTPRVGVPDRRAFVVLEGEK